jgi:hypothetical protein
MSARAGAHGAVSASLSAISGSSCAGAPSVASKTGASAAHERGCVVGHGFLRFCRGEQLRGRRGRVQIQRDADLMLRYGQLSSPFNVKQITGP